MNSVATGAAATMKVCWSTLYRAELLPTTLVLKTMIAMRMMAMMATRMMPTMRMVLHGKRRDDQSTTS